MTELETNVNTEGEATEQVGLRNKLSARWRALPKEQRWGLTIAFQLALAFVLWGLARSLTYAVLFIFALLWLRRVPPLPWGLGMEALLVLLFAIFGPRSLAIVLAIVFALLWVPHRYRKWLLPLAALLTAVAYPFFFDRMFTIPVFGAVPGHRNRRLHGRVHHDGRRPQHGRRLRRACSISATSRSTRPARTRRLVSRRSSSRTGRSTSAPSGSSRRICPGSTSRSGCCCRSPASSRRSAGS